MRARRIPSKGIPIHRDLNGFFMTTILPKKSKARLHEILFVHLSIILKTIALLLLRRPYKLTLLVAGGCNMQCRICTLWKNPNRTLSLEEVKEIWAAFPIKPCWINISGGEPTLNPALEELLLFFVTQKRSLFISLTTNGYRNCRKTIENVLRHNKRSRLYIALSLDGKATVHNALRGRPNAWERTHRTFEELLLLKKNDAYLTVGVSITISKFNYSRILSFVETMYSRTSAVNINLAQTSDYYENDSTGNFFQIPADRLAPLLRAIQSRLVNLRLNGILKTLYLDMAIRRIEGKRTKLPCASVFSNVLVTADLDLVDCIPLFTPWEPSDVSTRSQRLQRLCRTIGAPKHRREVLEKRICASKCEDDCLTPCESYVHLIAQLTNPLRALVLSYRFLAIYVTSVLFKPYRVHALAQDAIRSGSTER